MSDINYKLAWTLVGYVIGRTMHILNYYFTNNITWLPHHWILAILLFILSFFVEQEWLLYFSIGLLISDFNDFWNLKTFEPDATNTLPNLIGFD
jgi:hypothetical protein